MHHQCLGAYQFIFFNGGPYSGNLYEHAAIPDSSSMRSQRNGENSGRAPCLVPLAHDPPASCLMHNHVS